jgi:cytochrome c556
VNGIVNLAALASWNKINCTLFANTSLGGMYAHTGDPGMKRGVVLSLAGLMVSAATGAVIAQSDPIAARRALMKANNDNAKIAVAMMRGQAPFDPAKVDAAFAQWTETAQKFDALFPDNSKTGGDTRASPKIWENKADFNAHIAAFRKAVADNRDKAKASVEGLKVAIGAVGQTCDDCHEDYRLSRR